MESAQPQVPCRTPCARPTDRPAADAWEIRFIACNDWCDDQSMNAPVEADAKRTAANDDVEFRPSRSTMG
jgi:hypothetical protein